MLFNLVFGEGVINDATTIALLHTVKVERREEEREREARLTFSFSAHPRRARALLARDGPPVRPPAPWRPPPAPLSRRHGADKARLSRRVHLELSSSGPTADLKAGWTPRGPLGPPSLSMGIQAHGPAPRMAGSSVIANMPKGEV